jgi:hypothetical protein
MRKASLKVSGRPNGYAPKVFVRGGHKCEPFAGLPSAKRVCTMV